MRKEKERSQERRGGRKTKKEGREERRGERREKEEKKKEIVREGKEEDELVPYKNDKIILCHSLPEIYQSHYCRQISFCIYG